MNHSKDTSHNPNEPSDFSSVDLSMLHSYYSSSHNQLPKGFINYRRCSLSPEYVFNGDKGLIMMHNQSYGKNHPPEPYINHALC
jgi:hypothetical protein